MKEMTEYTGLDYIIDQYKKALEGSGPKLKEIILDRAAHDRDISVWVLRELVKAAYPEEA